MALEFRLPDIGEGLTEADVLRWYVDVGGHVGLDEPLVELETAKTVVDMPAPVAGLVLHHGAAVGATISVGEVLAVIGDADERWPRDPNRAGGPALADRTAGGRTPDEQASDDSRPDSGVTDDEEEHGQDPVPSPGSGAPLVGTLVDDAEELPTRTVERDPRPARPQALPLVRKLARDAGVALTDMIGTGPGGRVTREDLTRHVAARDAAGGEAGEGAGEGAGDEVGGTGVAGVAAVDARTVDRERMSMMRRSIAEHMVRSWTEIPHVTTFDDVDATRLLVVRRSLSERHGRPVPIEAFVGHACIRAIAEHPWFNATVADGEIVIYREVHLGVAVDTPQGLVAPVVPRADDMSLLELADAISDVADLARQRALRPEQTSGCTFTVSNIGAVGGTHGTPIIPHGTSAILSVGRAVDRPVAVGGEVGVAPMMPLSLSYDHRIIDGAMGRRFLAAVMADLAEPALFLV